MDGATLAGGACAACASATGAAGGCTAACPRCGNALDNYVAACAGNFTALNYGACGRKKKTGNETERGTAAPDAVCASCCNHVCG
jgi:hypothetical protein